MTDQPEFSVIIPTYNRAGDLARALAAWDCQQPADTVFEVIVVDDGSSDETRELLAAFRPSRFSLRRLGQVNAGPAAARNRALHYARGRLILFTGDDIEPESDLLAEHLLGHSEAADPDVAILGLTRWPDDLPVTATMRHVDGVGAQQFSYHWLVDGREYDFRHFYTSNISVQRSLVDLEPGGFSEQFPAAAFEDAEFAHRLAGHGLRILYRSSAVARHYHPYGARSFFERQVRCGRMAGVLWRLRPALARWLSVADLESLRLQTLRLGPGARIVLDRVAADLERWEGRALSLAEFYDAPEPRAEAQDDLLMALFRHGFLKGLAEELLDYKAARSATAASFLSLLPTAAATYRERLAAEGLPCPEADAAALAGLRPPSGHA